MNKKVIHNSFKFIIQVKSSSGSARTGILHTPHGNIETPFFMPVGTVGFVKTMTPEDLEKQGAQIMLSNTYHLYLRPGSKFIKKQGGLHEWIGWNKPILTDSGGYQVFSLGRDENPHKKNENIKTMVKLTDEGVEFRSHIDGSKHFFTPEKVIQTEHEIGADIIMVLDECMPHDSNRTYAEKSLKLTRNWALRCKKEHEKLEKKKKNSPAQALFPIVQGALYKDLRIESAKFCASLDLPGNAIGGLSVGESKEKMYEMVGIVTPHLPENKPRYLMGVGSPEDILECVERGIDMFDCVMPTRISRHGAFWTENGRFSIKNSKYKTSKGPLMKGCECYTCKHFSANYIRHLFSEEETLGLRLMTIHNLHFLLNLMRQIRINIKAGKFSSFKKAFLKKWTSKT